ncbi:MAG: hypothetical protein L6Q95_02810 [Planctomycetes bacterium]|nr:hypothetical protein [Planctomycetota bacterium]
MRRMWLQALVLCAFLARVALPALHFHGEEGGRGGECHGHRHDAEHVPAEGPAAAADEPACPICEILATKVQGVAPEPPPAEAATRPVAIASARIGASAPRSAEFSFVGSPRGPPPSSPA